MDNKLEEYSNINPKHIEVTSSECLDIDKLEKLT